MTNFLLFLHNIWLDVQNGTLPQLGNWTYFLLVLLVVIEGPSATLLGAAAASAGLMQPRFVFLAATIGNLTADSLWYSIGYLGKTEWLSHFRRFGLRPHLIEHIKQGMIKHTTQILLLAKFSLSFMIPTLITAGLLRIPWRRWFPVLIFADTLWTGLLVLVGYYSIESTRHVQRDIEYAVLFISILFLITLFMLGNRLKKQWDQGKLDSDVDSKKS